MAKPIEHYDAQKGPDPREWLALDETERLELVLRFHRKAGTKLPNATLHAAIHAVVETQVALGVEIPVRRTLERLQAEGLDRHDAIHAVGSVLAGQIHDIMKVGAPATEPNTVYWGELERLTAESWRRTG